MIPAWLRLAAALGVIYGMSRPLQLHAWRTLRAGRADLRVLLSVAAGTFFFYSVLMWVWWTRGTVYFPPFLLNARLEVRYYFELAMALATLGLFIDRRFRS